MKRKLASIVAIALLISVATSGLALGAKKQVLRFYYPIGVAGPLAQVIGGLCDEFNKSQSDIIVEAIYSGGYAETMQRSITAAKSGNPPDLALLTAADVWVAVDSDLITPLDTFVKQSGGDRFLNPYFPAFLNDCEVDGTLYAIPFQKSTPIFYYNKDMLKQAGLDPNRGPKDWAEVIDYAKKLTLRQGNTVSRWGVEIPIDQWLFCAMIMQAGGQVCNKAGNTTYFSSKDAVDALSYMTSLVLEHKVMPARRLFGDASADFVAGKTAMMYNSTGNLAFVRENAKFDWGVSFLPSGKITATPTGGGQFVIFKDIPKEKQAAAWEFVTWLTSAENAAKWSIASGYVPVRRDAYDVPLMKEYVQKYPQALVARDQLKYAQREQPACHEGRQVSQLITVMLEAALAGQGSPQDLLRDLQVKVTSVLSPYSSK